MLSEVLCPECSNPLPAAAPAGLCPRCLLSLVVEGTSDLDGTIDCGDRDLLMGLVGLQLRIVTPEAFVTASAACAIAPYLGLIDRLVESGTVTPAETALLHRVAQVLVEHNGGVRPALEHIGDSFGIDGLGALFEDPPFPETIVAKLSPPHYRAKTEEDEDRQIKEVPGRYVDVRELVRGGMGRVLIARDEFLDREVVLKELAPPRMASQLPGSSASTAPSPAEVSARFLREARLTGQLEHPSIVPVYELGQRLDGTPYYTMKFVRGRTLAEVLGKARTLEKRMRYLSHYLDLCQAIAYAHSRNVIHRDIKPSNIMIGEFGETVVIDWGLAKAIGETDRVDSPSPGTHRKAGSEGSPAQTARGVLIGTPHYMAPEQARGSVKDIDQRTDVFALGVVLYELLTGQLPYDADTDKDVLLRIRTAPPTPIRDIEHNAPVEIVSICERAMAPVRADRYAHAGELAEDVERFMTGAMVQAYEYTAWEAALHLYNRNRLPINTVLFAILVVAFFGVFSYYNILDARNEAVVARDEALAARDAAEMARVEADVQRHDAATAQQAAEYRQYGADIRLARDSIERGRALQARAALEFAPERYRNWEWGYLANRAWPRAVPESALAILEPVDGATAADYWRNATPQRVATIQAAAADVSGVRFISGGRRLATKTLDGSAAIWDVTTGECVVSFEGADPYYGPLVLSPNERYAARSLGDNDLGLYDAHTGGQIGTLKGHTEIALPIAFSSDGTVLASVGYDQRFMFWSIPSGEQLAVLAANPEFWGSGRSGRFFGHFAGDPAHFVTFQDHNIVRVWNWQSGEVIAEHTLPTGPGYALEALSPDGAVAALASFESGVAVGMNLATGSVLWRARSQPIPDSVSYKFSPDGTLFAGRTDDERLLLFATDEAPDPNTGFINPIAEVVQLSTFKHQDCVAFDPTGRLLAVPESDGSVKIYAPSAVSTVGPDTVLPHPDTVLQAHFEIDSRHVVSACFDGVVRRWDLEQGRSVAAMHIHTGPITHLTPSANSSLWLSRSTDNTRKIINVADQRVLLKSESHQPADFAGGARGPLVRVGASQAPRRAFTRDGTRWLHAGAPGDLVVAAFPSGDAIHVLGGHAELVYRSEFTPDETKIIGHGYQQTFIKIWDAATGRELQQLDGPVRALHTSVSPDSKLIAVAYLSGLVQIWDLTDPAERPNPIHVLKDHRGTAYNVDFDPTGKYLATAGGDAHAKVWRTDTWALVADLDTHKNIVMQVRFSPDGQRVLTGSNDNSIRVFDLTGRELIELPAGGTFAYAEWSPDGQRILATTTEGLVRVWTALPRSEWPPAGKHGTSE